MAGKVRPFEENLEVSSSVYQVRGIIDCNRFVITSVLLRIEVETSEIGKDEKGPFAILTELEYIEPDGTLLSVEHEGSESWSDGYKDRHGLIISKAKPVSSKTIGDLEVHAVCHTGYLPSAMNLIVPPEWSFSVYFNSIGNFDGFGICGHL
ncbi:MAG: hypothetical protein WD425_09510 [Nitrospirales bacterium]